MITDPPPLSPPTLSEKKKKKKKRKEKIKIVTRETWHGTCDMWDMTWDMWHVTRDTWHMKRDTWNVTCLGRWTFPQNFSSLALTVCDLWYNEDLENKAESGDDEAVYRTAPATLGLLNMTKIENVLNSFHCKNLISFNYSFQQNFLLIF